MTTMVEYTFDTPEPLEVLVSNASGDVIVHCDDNTTTYVNIDARREEDAEATTVELQGRRLRVEAPTRRFGFGTQGIEMHLSVPSGSRVAVKAASSDVTVTGAAGDLNVQVASGDVTAERVTGSARVQSASGDIVLGPVSGEVYAKTASGDIRVAGAGSLNAGTASGDLDIGTITGAMSARSSSGDIRVADAVSGEISMSTTSGDITVAVRPGTSLKIDMFSRSGTVRSELDVDDLPPETGLTLDLQLQSTSGDITLRRGAPA
jgi:DUF4097 and DUF4098 domain-containing protein YvlB